MKYLFTLVATGIFLTGSSQQKLQPGFDPKEYDELLSLTFHSSSIADSAIKKKQQILIIWNIVHQRLD